jgi:hypothetical protein
MRSTAAIRDNIGACDFILIVNAARNCPIDSTRKRNDGEFPFVNKEANRGAIAIKRADDVSKIIYPGDCDQPKPANL